MAPTRLAAPADLPLSGGGEEAAAARADRPPPRGRFAAASGRGRSACRREADTPRLAEIVERLQAASRSEGPRLVEGWLDRLDASGRWALIKLVTGGLRIGVSARLAKQAVADLGGRPVNDIEEVWHGLTPPYARPLRLAGRARAGAGIDDQGALPPGDAGAGDRRRRPRPDHAGDLRRRMEVGRHPRAGGARGRRRAALHAHRRRHLAHLPRHRRRARRGGGARRRTAGRARGRATASSCAASPTCSSG